MVFFAVVLKICYRYRPCFIIIILIFVCLLISFPFFFCALLFVILSLPRSFLCCAFEDILGTHTQVYTISVCLSTSLSRTHSHSSFTVSFWLSVILFLPVPSLSHLSFFNLCVPVPNRHTQNLWLRFHIHCFITCVFRLIHSLRLLFLFPSTIPSTVSNSRLLSNYLCSFFSVFVYRSEAFSSLLSSSRLGNNSTPRLLLFPFI